MFCRFPKLKSEEKKREKIKIMLTVLKVIANCRLSFNGVARISNRSRA